MLLRVLVVDSYQLLSSFIATSESHRCHQHFRPTKIQNPRTHPSSLGQPHTHRAPDEIADSQKSLTIPTQNAKNQHRETLRERGGGLPAEPLGGVGEALVGLGVDRVGLVGHRLAGRHQA